jgi:hypothetical protein
MPVVMGYCAKRGDVEATAAVYAGSLFARLLARQGLSISPLHAAVQAVASNPTGVEQALWLNAMPDCAGRGTT